MAFFYRLLRKNQQKTNGELKCFLDVLREYEKILFSALQAGFITLQANLSFLTDILV